MRPIHIAPLDKARPALILTRELVRPHLHGVSVAPITSTIRGLSIEVPVGHDNGLDHESIVSCDNIVAVPTFTLGRHVGYFLPRQEPARAEAIHVAFDLA
jgi:mRNA interferase MazF